MSDTLDYISLPLKNSDMVALVDREDETRLAVYEWRPMPRLSYTGQLRIDVVACGRHIPAIYMHRFILGVTDSAILVDHRSHDTLDNRKSNIRAATQQQNQCNRLRPSHNTSGYKGVSRTAEGNWKVYVSAKRVRYCIGTFKDRVEAAKAYDQAAIRLHGEFACTNFPIGDYPQCH